MFSAPVAVWILLLIPGQSRTALGIELIVVGAVLAPWLAVLNRPWGRPPEWALGSWILGNATAAALLAISVIVAGIGLITETLGGLYWLPVGVVAALRGALLNTWVLLVEIRREQGQRQPRLRTQVIASTAMRGLTLSSSASRHASTDSSRRSVDSADQLAAACRASPSRSGLASGTSAPNEVTSTSR